MIALRRRRLHARKAVTSFSDHYLSAGKAGIRRIM